MGSEEDVWRRVFRAGQQRPDGQPVCHQLRPSLGPASCHTGFPGPRTRPRTGIRCVECDHGCMAAAHASTRSRLWRRVWPPAVAVTAVVAIFVSDWPLNWSFWIQHPLISALVPGLVLILVAAAIVDGFLRRREARRWRQVGSAAAGELANHFQTCSLVLADLLGAEMGGNLGIELDHHLSQARERKDQLLGEAPTVQYTAALHQGRQDPGSAVAEVLPTLLLDEIWRDNAWSCLALFNSRQASLLGQWASIYAVAADEAVFTRLGQTVQTIELAHAVQNDIAAIQYSGDDTSTMPTSRLDDAIADTVNRWTRLFSAYVREGRYWAKLSWEQATTEAPSWDWDNMHAGPEAVVRSKERTAPGNPASAPNSQEP